MDRQLRVAIVSFTACAILSSGVGAIAWGSRAARAAEPGDVAPVTTSAANARVELTSARVAQPRVEQPRVEGARIEGTSPASGVNVAASTRCPRGMAEIPLGAQGARGGRSICIDRYEASLVEILPSGTERPWSPYVPIAPRHAVRAVSEPGKVPQAYVSAQQASSACARSHKRLCKVEEWQTACRGPASTVYPYGNRNVPGRCNDSGRSPVIASFGLTRSTFTWKKMNAPFLNQLPDTLAATGSHEGCTNAFGVFDMVGNLHEWVADARGSFYGGYYQDTHQHGDGCSYKTTAHSATYHDYSTGFRCCADPED